MIIRSGIGYDIHQLIATQEHGLITICGIKITCPYFMKAHSDGDVGLHALTDAMLGAIAAGDIGLHFPPSDPKWQNCNSNIFLQHALYLLKEAGGVFVNADITIICEEPKIMPYSIAMKTHIADILQTTQQQVNIKAKTNEQLGCLGRKEGIAAQAICNVAFPKMKLDYDNLQR